MFEHVTNSKSVAGAGRNGLFLLGSSLVQGGVVVAVVLAASMIKARVADEPVVPVKLARIVPAAPPAPPATPTQPRVEHRRPTAAVKPLAALVAPRTIPASVPEVSEPEEEEAPASVPSDAVVGGVVGEVASAAPAAPAPPPPPKPVVKDEPSYAGAGFVRPRVEDPSCLRANLQLPRGLEGMAAAVTAKFAVGVDGAPSLFSVQPADADARLASAIWEAIRTCRWIAGTDSRGRATKIWVLMPFRFRAN